MLNLVHNGHIGIGRLSTRISRRDKDIVSSQLRSARRVSSLLGFNSRTHLPLRIAFGYDPHVRHVSGLCLHLPQETACFKLVNEQPRMHERTVLHGNLHSPSVPRACGSAAASFNSSPEGNKEHNRHQHQQQQTQGSCQSFRIGWQRRSKGKRYTC